MERFKYTFAKESFTNFTKRGGLIPLAHFASSIGFFESFSGLDLKMKGIRYSPINKIQTIIASVACGCKHNVQINKKLKGDTPSAKAFGMESFPDQSLINRFLHSFRKIHISQESGMIYIRITTWRRRARIRSLLILTLQAWWLKERPTSLPAKATFQRRKARRDIDSLLPIVEVR